jgi:HNH endonuclease.
MYEVDYLLKLLKKPNPSTLDIIRAAKITSLNKCCVTGETLTNNNTELHHRTPVEFGGDDTVENLILLDKRAHYLIHSDSSRKYLMLLDKLGLNEAQIRKVDQLMYEIHSRV